MGSPEVKEKLASLVFAGGLPFLSNKGEEYKMKPCITKKAKNYRFALKHYPNIGDIWGNYSL
jgi:hypothetical protein